jgi:hypothetical protein
MRHAARRGGGEHALLAEASREDGMGSNTGTVASGRDPATGRGRGRRVLLLGGIAATAALCATAFAWRDGLWAAPIALVAIAATGRIARRRPWTRPVIAGVVLATVAAVTLVQTVVASGGLAPALRTDESTYQPGEQVEVQLRAGLQTVGYNLCFAFATLEQRDDAGWVPTGAHLGPPSDDLVACTSELRGLAPLFGAEGAVHLPPDLAPGDYRLTYDLEFARGPVTSRPFTVASG